jgi:hypothetical protein
MLSACKAIVQVLVHVKQRSDEALRLFGAKTASADVPLMKVDARPTKRRSRQCSGPG